MKRIFTHQPIIPKGYTGKDINSWYKYIHEQVSKIKKK